MNGINIVDVIEIYELAWWQFILGLTPMIICAVILFIRMYKAFKKGSAEEQARSVLSAEHWHPKEILWIFLGGLLSFILLLCLKSYCPADHVETRYEVAVTDSVTFNDFYKTYEIIEARSDTFIVKERE